MNQINETKQKILVVILVFCAAPILTIEALNARIGKLEFLRIFLSETGSLNYFIQLMTPLIVVLLILFVIFLILTPNIQTGR